MYERVSARGTRYLIGRFGLAKIVILPNEMLEDGTATWRILVQQAGPAETPPPRPRPPTRKIRRDFASGPPMPDDPVSDLWREGER